MHPLNILNYYITTIILLLNYSIATYFTMALQVLR